MAPREANNPFADQFLTIEYDATAMMLPQDTGAPAMPQDNNVLDTEDMETEGMGDAGGGGGVNPNANTTNLLHAAQIPDLAFRNTITGTAIGGGGGTTPTHNLPLNMNTNTMPPLPLTLHAMPGNGDDPSSNDANNNHTTAAIAATAATNNNTQQLPIEVLFQTENVDGANATINPTDHTPTANNHNRHLFTTSTPASAQSRLVSINSIVELIHLPLTYRTQMKRRNWIGSMKYWSRRRLRMLQPMLLRPLPPLLW